MYETSVITVILLLILNIKGESNLLSVGSVGRHGGNGLLLLLLLDGAGPLSDFASADRFVLEECVIPVRNHGTVAEERRCLECLDIGRCR